MAKKLVSAEEGILKSVADNLRQIALGEMAGPNDDRPLSVHVLRGGMYRSEAWARNPLQPTVVASTVDQIGSRLLFRAYGRGHRTCRSTQDSSPTTSLILLDEAHCAQPFLQTLQAVRRFRTWAHEPLGRPFYPVVMSATPPPGIHDVFEDRSDERRDPAHRLGMRQRAHKPAILKALREPGERKPPTPWQGRWSRRHRFNQRGNAALSWCSSTAWPRRGKPIDCWPPNTETARSCSLAACVRSIETPSCDAWVPSTRADPLSAPCRSRWSWSPPRPWK